MFTPLMFNKMMTREQLFSVEDCMLDLLREISKMTTGREEAEQMIFSHAPEWFVEDLKQVRIHNLLRYIIYHLFLPLISQWLDDEASYSYGAPELKLMMSLSMRVAEAYSTPPGLNNARRCCSDCGTAGNRLGRVYPFLFSGQRAEGRVQGDEGHRGYAHAFAHAVPCHWRK